MIFYSATEDTVLNIYWVAEKKCRKYTKVMAGFVFIDQSVFFLSFIASFYNIFVGNLDTSTWELPLRLVVPFNTERISMWYTLCIIQYSMSISYSLCISATTSYFISGCFYIAAICDHFDALIDSLKEDIQPNDETSKSKPIESTKRMHGQLKEKLRNAVEIHVKLYE